MRRLFSACLTATALAIAAASAQAGCAGPSLLDRLTPAERASVETAAATTPFGEGILWRAQKGDRQIDLIGTMHLFDPRHDATMEAIAPTLAAADLILLEMTPTEERQMLTAMAEAPEVFFITDGPTLPDLLPEDDWIALRDAARARQMPGFLAAKSQPWFLMASLGIPPCAMGDLIEGRFGLDKLIINVATDLGTPMSALEAWTTLPELFDEIPADEQLEMLALSVLSPDLQQEAFVAMLESYFQGQIALIWEMSRMSASFVPNMTEQEAEESFAMTQELLLDRRNAAWLPVILEAADTHERVVVAVGAAHLPDTTGVLRMLEQEGWTISAQQ
ncbi:TraB/GumN family protein [Flavimaricola marinus]|uniref:TraB family protein n=1 Tax=Flavimaricola marinus TaxID=1819565 RepID=A0A238L8L7_9RHOB|nr:TraB/GumN family protein [Flavimaricola marinus]SMY05941.1 TraB family protein [Flavimaricola marinus]